MKKKIILISMIVVIFAGFIQIFAQQKITLETTRLPDRFEGHNPAILFRNLTALAKLNKSDKKSIAEFLKGKKIYQNLTTDDLFAFSLETARGVIGRTEKNNTRFGASLYPFLNLENFPPPKPMYLGFSAYDSAIPLISSPDDLVSEYISELDLESFWKSHYLTIQTVYPAAALRKKYIGDKKGCVYIPFSNELCRQDGFIVPSPQIHYGLGFVGKQPFTLVNTTNSVFSPETYRFEDQKGAGLAALYDNGEKYRQARPIFIVKLAAPYFAAKSFQTFDEVEKKPLQTVRNLLYVELVGIWLYDYNSNQIVSKTGEKMTQ